MIICKHVKVNTTYTPFPIILLYRLPADQIYEVDWRGQAGMS